MTNYLPKLLLTGANGQLAQALWAHPSAQMYRIFACTREQIDITHPCVIDHALTHIKPDFIINTAAYTAVDQAEQEKEKALQVNDEGAKNLAIACNKHHIPLVHISTDYIFDGRKNTPYVEEDRVNPLNHYGKTKWLGEEVIRQYTEQHLILRVSSIFSEYGNNFLKTILHLICAEKEIRIVSDQISCPTYAQDIATTLFLLLKQRAIGTYHFCSDEPVSWYEFAKTIVAETKITKELKAISTTEYKAAAQRPLYSVLDCSKIQHDFAITQPSWREGIKRAISVLTTGKKG